MSDKILFPGGLELPVPAGITPNEAFRLHFGVSLTEGICPYHQVPLGVASGDSTCTPDTGLPWLHHSGCGYYWQVDAEHHTWTQEADWAWLGLPPPQSH